MRVVVTGATGFVGKWLVRELIKQGTDVTVIVRNKDRVPAVWNDYSVEVVEASLNRIALLEKGSFSKDTYDIFYHFAWAGTSGMERADTRLQLGNAQAACEAVMLAKKLGCSSFVNAGSIMEYEAMQYIVQDSAIPGMGNIYSIAKMTADFMAKTVASREGIRYINVIISNIYGAGEKSARFLNTVLRKMLANERIPLTHGEQLYDFIYVTDAVRAIVYAGINGENNSSYYIGNPCQHPLKEFILRMKELVESKSELAFGEVPYIGARLSYQEFDTKKLANMGFVMEIPFEEGINLTKRWIMEEEDEYQI